jgi:hypothetical protein
LSAAIPQWDLLPCRTRGKPVAVTLGIYVLCIYYGDELLTT